MKNETLHLTLNKQWFDMIKSGEKKEEYRSIVPYWTKRLCEFNKKENVYEIYKFKFVEFSLGYPKKGDTEKIMKFKINDIVIGLGKEEWGAEPGMNYFIIRLGDKV